MKTLIATLGTGGYDPAYYELNGSKALKTRLGFKALMEILDIPIERVFVFGTKADTTTGLRGSDWNILDQEFGISFPEHQKIEVPYGLNKTEHYQFFESVISTIDDTDELIFDISHGFRSTPVIFLMSLFFKASLDDHSFQKLRVFYGAFEAGIDTTERFKKTIKSGSATKEIDAAIRTVQLVEMEIVPELLSWVKATERFTRYGISQDLADLTKENSEVKFMSNNLEQLNTSIAYNSIETIIDTSRLLNKKFEENKKRIPATNPAYYIAPKINGLLNEFDKKLVSEQQLAAVHFFYRTNRYGQVSVALQEYLISLLTENWVGTEPKLVYKKANRDPAKNMIGLLNDQNTKTEADIHKYTQLKASISEWDPAFFKEMSTALNRLPLIRNTFAHAKKLKTSELEKFHSEISVMVETCSSWNSLRGAPVKKWLMIVDDKFEG